MEDIQQPILRHVECPYCHSVNTVPITSIFSQICQDCFEEIELGDGEDD